MSIILSIVAGLVGIAGTILAYRLNPKQKLYDQLDRLKKRVSIAEKERDIALSKNDSDRLSIAVNQLVELRKSQSDIFKRLTEN